MQRIFTSLTTGLIYLLFISSIMAQPMTDWAVTYGGSFNDIPNVIQPRPEGGFLIGGLTTSNDDDITTNFGLADGWIMSVNATGALQWSRNYGGNQHDEIKTIVRGNDGGYIIGGYSYSNDNNLTSNNGLSDFWIFKITAQGNIVWSSSFGGKGAEHIEQIVPTTNGYFLLGQTNSPDFPVNSHFGDMDAVVTKITNTGIVQWSKKWGATDSESVKAMRILTNGNLLIAGASNSRTADHRGAMDGWLSLLDSDGNLLWSKHYGGTLDDEFNAVLQNANGQIFIGGFAYSRDGDLDSNSGLRDAWIMEIDPQGNPIWSQNYGGNEQDESLTLALDNNTLIVGGSSASADIDGLVPLGNQDFWLMALSNSGNIIWQTNYGGRQLEKIQHIAVGNNNGLLLAGVTSSSFENLIGFTKGMEDAFLVKLMPSTSAPLAISLGPDQFVCDGQIATIEVENNCNNCSFLWNDGDTSPSREIVIAQNIAFQVTVTDEQGETAMDDITINVIANPTLEIETTATDFCVGSNITMIANPQDCSGCSFIWNDGNTQNNRTITLQNDISYTLTISSSAGCTTSQTVLLSLSDEADFTATVNPVSCPNLTDGSIALQVNQAGNINATWNTGQSGTTLSNLSSGNYSVTITGSGFCPTIESFEITAPSDWNTTITTTDVVCGGENGEVQLIVNGGAANNNFLWSNGVTTQNIDDLAPGNYQVTITNLTGCTTTAAADILVNNQTFSSLEAVDMICQEAATGSATVLLSNGTLTPTYLWNNGATTPFISNLSAGTYTVTVTLNNGCENNHEITISEFSNLTVTGNISTPACFNQPTGIILTTVNGGASNYSYEWSNGQTNSNLSGLTGGNYQLTVTDQAGCTSSQNFLVTQPNPILANPITTPVSCSGETDGQVVLNPSGGDGNYSFNWVSGPTTATLIDLPTGVYNVAITDGQGCSTTSAINIGSPAPIIFNVAENPPSAGQSNGSILAIPTGGTAPYGVLWNTGSTSFQVANLSAGAYSVTATDNSGCKGVKTIFLGISTTASVEDLVNDFTVFPNPNQGAFRVSVELLNPVVYEISVLNVLGQVIWRYADRQSVSIPVNLGEISSGIYFVHLKTTAGQLVERIFVD